MTPRAELLLTDGFEEVEALTPVDLLRRAGFELETLAVGPGLEVTGKHGIPVRADRTLGDSPGDLPDLLVLPGGPGVATLRKDRRVVERARAQHQAGRTLGAICAAPLVLLEARILPGRPYTGHFTIREELPDLAAEPVVVAGPLITSQGAGTAVPFALTLIREVIGEEKAGEVAASICYPG